MKRVKRNDDLRGTLLRVQCKISEVLVPILRNFGVLLRALGSARGAVVQGACDLGVGGRGAKFGCLAREVQSDAEVGGWVVRGSLSCLEEVLEKLLTKITKLVDSVFGLWQKIGSEAGLLTRRPPRR